MYKTLDLHERSEKLVPIIHESYEGEIQHVFEEADKDAGGEVDVAYARDAMTGEDIELWRKDWL